MTGELSIFQWNLCFKCKSMSTKQGCEGVSTLSVCCGHEPVSWAGIGMPLLPISFILSDKGVPCQAHHVGRFISKMCHSRSCLGHWLSKWPFIKPAALLVLPCWLWWTGALRNSCSHLKSRVESPHCLSLVKWGTFNHQSFPVWKEEEPSSHGFIDSLPGKNVCLSTAKPHLWWLTGSALSLWYTISPVYHSINTTSPLQASPLLASSPCRAAGAAWELSSPLIPRNLNSRF